jgi:hypothetical protein
MLAERQLEEMKTELGEERAGRAKIERERAGIER